MTQTNKAKEFDTLKDCRLANKMLKEQQKQHEKELKEAYLRSQEAINHLKEENQELKDLMSKWVCGGCGAKVMKLTQFERKVK